MQTFGVATLPAAPQFVLTERFRSQVTHRDGANGSKILDNLRIFKTGTFADSLGIIHTWEDIHLEQMVAHFRLLRDGGYLPDVPVRADHSFSVKDVVGYFTDVYKDPQDPQFLSSSIEFTEPDAFEKWDRGTWRSRSIEVGTYVTNDQKEFWPVVMGLAFVDLPAVEGLHERPKNDKTSFYRIGDKEIGNNMNALQQWLADNPGKTEADWVAAVTYSYWLACANYAQHLVDWEKAVTYAAAIQQQLPPPAPPAPPAPHNLPQPPPAPPAPPARSTFRVNGVETQDLQAVQVHIDALETFRTDTTTKNRTDFVNGLAANNIILASQLTPTLALVATMTPEQFDGFRAMYENAAPSSVLNPVTPTPANQPPSKQTTQEEIAVLEEGIANHKRVGMTDDQIKNTQTYRRLQELKSPAAS